jgi:toxin ParE1/3/4
MKLKKTLAKYIIELLEPAELEITEACEWYEEQQPGLATKLLNEIDHYLGLIAQDPFLFVVRFDKKHRIAILKTFPYLIIFRINEKSNTVYVNSFFHTSRKPYKFPTKKPSI